MAEENVTTEVGGVAVDRLRSLIERIERFDVKAMRTVLKLRKMNAADRDEQELVVDTYRKALDI